MPETLHQSDLGYLNELLLGPRVLVLVRVPFLGQGLVRLADLLRRSTGKNEMLSKKTGIIPLLINIMTSLVVSPSVHAQDSVGLESGRRSHHQEEEGEQTGKMHGEAESVLKEKKKNKIV